MQRLATGLITLVSTPLILRALGVEDYGLYTLTVGFVGTLSFVNWSLSSATQRYIAFAIGENDLEKVNKTFSTTLLIHFVYGILLLCIIIIISVFFVDQVLNIPKSKIEVAQNIVLLVGFITFFKVISIPCIGLLRAYENFIYISIIGLFESVSKLTIAFLIIYIPANQLFYFVLFLVISSVLAFIFYALTIRNKFKNIYFKLSLIKVQMMKEILSFISWSLLGAVAIVSRNQGVQVILNIFFGVVINAAYGITMQVNSALSILSQGIIGSINPQIIKSAGAKDYNRMLFLMRTMAKFALFSVSIISVPILFNIQIILNFWLPEVPNGTETFVKLIIILGQVMLLSAGLQTVFNAIGKVKVYNIWVSSILMFNIPLAFIFFKMGFPGYVIIIIGIILELISFQIRLFLLNKYVSFSLKELYYDLLVRSIIPVFLLYVLLYALELMNVVLYQHIMISIFLSFFVFPVAIYHMSLEDRQQSILKELFVNKILNR